MKYKILSLLSFVILGLGVNAQYNEPTLHHLTMGFEREPKNAELTETDTSSFGVILRSKNVVQFAYDRENDNQLVEYRTVYKKVKLTTERAIKEYNKTYINLNNAIELVKARGRVIKSDNSIVNLKNEDILEAENFEEYGRFKYFAFEGIELGADIEYMYTIKRYPNYNGNRFIFQGRSEKRNVEFICISPSNLLFDFKSLNGFPEVLQDTTDTLQNFYSAKADLLTRIDPEDYSARDVSLQGVVYKLEGNTYGDKDRIVNYAQAGQNIHANMHWAVSSSDKKALLSLSKKLKITKSDQDKQLRKLENYLKTNLNVVNQGGDDFENISKILANKNCNQTGLIKIYVAWIEALGIDYNICLGSDRQDVRFEKDFEVYDCLGDYFFYFPDIDKYIVPEYWPYRLGLLPSEFTYNYALFMKPVTIGDFTTYMSWVDWVDPSPASATYTNLDMTIDLGEDFEKTEVKMKKTMAGHEAVFFQTSFESLNQEQLDQIEPILITFFGDEEKTIDKSYENTSAELLFIEPMIINATIDYPNIVENAGPKRLLKVGNIIGPQAEMYNEKERKLDIEIDYNHGYVRDITIPIPSGYKISNLEDLNFEEKVVVDGERIMGFTSTYKEENGAIVVHVDELYDRIHLSKDYYEDFKKVINAAADFNKVVLVFEKI